MKFLLLTFFFIAVTFSQELIDSYYNELKRLEKQSGEEITEIYLEELHRFYNLFENSTYAPEVTQRLAKQYYKINKYDLSIIYYLKLIIVYKYDVDNSLKRVNDIVYNIKKKRYELVASFISQQLDYLKEELDLDREYYYLKTIAAFAGDDMVPHVRGEIESYFKGLDKKKNSAESYILLANTYQKEKDYRQALIHYLQFLKIFPKSNSIPYALLQVANLYQMKLDEPNNAYIYYSRLVERYRYYPSAHIALFQLAEIFRNDLEEKEKAIKEYKRYVNYYPKEKYAIKSLENTAELYIEGEKYQEAILTLRKIVDDYRDKKEAKKALLLIAELFDKKLNKKEMAVDEMVNYAIYFPKDPESVELLYDAVNILVNKLDMKIKASSIAQILKDTYSEHRYSGKVDQLISIN